MRGLKLTVVGAILVLVMTAIPSMASADFGLKEVSLSFNEEDSSPATGAGTHPYSVTTHLFVNSKPDPLQGEVPEDQIKDLSIELPPGLVGDPFAVPRCSEVDFATLVNGLSSCPDEAAVGFGELKVALPFEAIQTQPVAVYNLEPSPGMAAKLGFVTLGEPVTIELRVNPEPPHNVIVDLVNLPQAIRFFGSDIFIWGNPASPVHDNRRGTCALSKETCAVDLEEKPFLTMPRSCTGSMQANVELDSWQNPGAFLDYPVDTGIGMVGCEDLEFDPEIVSDTSTHSANSSSGLEFDLDVEDKGLIEVGGTAKSDIEKAVVTLPEGITINPSVANGLEGCSEAGFDAETLDSYPGQGCPLASKVGSVEVETPLLEGKLLRGNIFVASPHANPFGSLLAIYMVIREPQLGILVKLPGKVEADPVTGQLVTTFGDAPYEIPQFPFSHFRFRFREGERAPLVTPPRCGEYETKAVFYPWANPTAPFSTSSTFTIDSGSGGAPCPSDTPFSPGFEAGSTNNTAGAFSPFYMRLSRSDVEQELTRFSTVLPAGVVGKLAGVEKCSDAAIAAAKSKSGFEELAAPSCPAGAKIGRTMAGAGVGDALTWVPGSLYLAGPYNGDPLSVVAITPAVTGPFDVGNVVIREALTLNPITAEVEVDGSAADPFPRILQGIPLRLRDLRVYIDRDGFTLNPTSCEAKATKARISGLGVDLLSSADDPVVDKSAPFEVTDCGNLNFKPKLSLSLIGKTKRSQHPALRSFLSFPYPSGPGHANVAKAVVTLPATEFIDNSHIQNPCTRVQFNADQCPPGSVLGRAKAITPLLDKPLEGPVYFRSNGGEHLLPDIVADLEGEVEIVLVGWVKSVGKKRPRLRTTFETVPDAPVTSFSLNLFGGKRGLLVNSRDLCKGKLRSSVAFDAQNGRKAQAQPVVKTSCKKRPHK